MERLRKGAWDCAPMPRIGSRLVSSCGGSHEEQGHTARLTEEERKNYLERLENYDENLTIDYSDDNLPFYNLDREIDDFSVKDAKELLTNAEQVDEIDPSLIVNQKWIQEEYKKQLDAKSLVNDWFADFDEVLKIQNS